MRIVVLDGYTENPGDLSWDELETLGELVVYDRTPVEKIIQRIGDANVVYTNKTPITKETIQACPKMKFIGVLATGYNVVDIETAKEAGIIVSNIPTYGTDSVAQFTIALLLELCHHVGKHSDAVKKGDWSNNEDWCFWNHPLIELADKTLGIIGFGRIGQRTAEIAKALKMKIIIYDQNPNKGLGTDAVKFVSFNELLEKSDFISLHCPQLPSTEGIINKNTISKMKDGVMIINSSRGGLIIEEDLRDALNSGKVAGAAVDVVSREPIEMGNPLLEAKNIIITPHIAWAPKESRQRLMDIAVENLRTYIKGQPQNVVNY